MPGPQRARPAGPEHAYPSSGQVLRRILISRHFLFENRSLVDFQIGNEPYIAHGDNFFSGKRSLVNNAFHRLFPLSTRRNGASQRDRILMDHGVPTRRDFSDTKMISLLVPIS